MLTKYIKWLVLREKVKILYKMAQVWLETKCVILNKNKYENEDKIHFLIVDSM